jgi:transcriptional regulator with XRE-family HTH domain
MSVGQMIRAIRQKQNLTLSDLAEKAGLTVGGLSQIERDLVNPTIPTLRRIAQELEVPVFTLLMEPDDPDGIVVLHNRRRVFTIPATNASYEMLSPHTRRRFEVARFALEPGAATADEPLSHPGEECCIILKGMMCLKLGEQSFVLNTGDTAQFDSGIPHRYVNTGPGVAEAMDVMSPPFI